MFSELSRVGRNGEVVKSDGGGTAKAREILSPALARGAMSSFHIYVDVKPDQKWTLYVGQNPDKALGVTLYKEEFSDPVAARQFGPLVENPQPVEGTGPGLVWLDLFVDRNASVQRVKIEPQLTVEGVPNWITYPMEVRVMSTVIPDFRSFSASPIPAAPVSGPSDSAGLAALASWLCNGRPMVTGPGNRQTMTVEGFLARNAAQDSALMQASQDTDWLWLATKAPDRKAWCKNPARPAGASAEWYLRVRDRLVAR